MNRETRGRPEFDEHEWGEKMPRMEREKKTEE